MNYMELSGTCSEFAQKSLRIAQNLLRNFSEFPQNLLRICSEFAQNLLRICSELLNGIQTETEDRKDPVAYYLNCNCCCVGFPYRFKILSICAESMSVASETWCTFWTSQHAFFLFSPQNAQSNPHPNATSQSICVHEYVRQAKLKKGNNNNNNK